MHLRYSILVVLLLIALSSAFAQEQLLYKQIDTTKLILEVHYPEAVDSATKYPAMVFFFGGGWNVGDKHHMTHHAEYFASRGLVCFLADYRTKTKNGTTPFESLKDAKSAMRFIRSNASEFGIDPDKIIASGGSTGAHLAAATALIDGYSEMSDHVSVSCKPNALVLFNPVIDNGPGGYGYERVSDAFRNFSPLHNIRKGAPPTIFLLGSMDKLTPIVTAQYYKMVMEKVGSRCDLEIYKGLGHGFFNYTNKQAFLNSTYRVDKFLESLGYLHGEPTIASQTQNALYFNGEDDHVSIKGVDFVPGDNISVSFWFNAHAFPVSDLQGKNVAVILSKAFMPTDKDIAMELKRTGSKTYLRGWVANNLNKDELFFNGSIALSINTWYHFAVTFDNAEDKIRVYQDGELVDEVLNAMYDFDSESADISIGNWVGKGGGYAFKGFVDEVRIWRSVRTQQQIQDNMCHELDDAENLDDLVGYYQCNETSGDTLPDKSRYSSDGVLKMKDPDSHWIPADY